MKMHCFMMKLTAEARSAFMMMPDGTMSEAVIATGTDIQAQEATSLPNYIPGTRPWKANMVHLP